MRQYHGVGATYDVIDSIHEVYYDKDDKVTGWTENPITASCHPLDDENMKEELERFMKATLKPILDFKTGMEITP